MVRSPLGLLSASITESSLCAPSDAQIWKAAQRNRCRMRLVGRLRCCVVLSQVGVALDSSSQSHKGGSERCACTQGVCTAQCRQHKDSPTRRHAAPRSSTCTCWTNSLSCRGPYNFGQPGDQPASNHQLAPIQPHLLGTRVIIHPYSWLAGGHCCTLLTAPHIPDFALLNI